MRALRKIRSGLFMACPRGEPPLPPGLQPGRATIARSVWKAVFDCYAETCTSVFQFWTNSGPVAAPAFMPLRLYCADPHAEAAMFDLNNVAIFVKVVETGSMAAAARALGMPSNTVGRRLAQLEAALGISLLHRTTRKLHVTDAGNHYYEQCVRQIGALEDATRTLADATRSPCGRLRIAAPAGFFEFMDLADMAEFMTEHGGLELEFILDDECVNLIERGIDIALRAGPLESSTLKARKIAEVRRILVASPAYLERAGMVTRPEQLAERECLLPSNAPGRNLWRLRNGSTLTEVKVRGRFAANSAFTLVKAARSHLGIALLPEAIPRADLARGTLVRLLPDHTTSTEGFYAVYPGHRQRSRAVQAFVDFVAAWMRRTNAPASDVLPAAFGERQEHATADA
ncbi:LysR family transcriptional regulator [Oxalobacteraceae bacterium OM1]|nr:LysR family transcriptional regulator [Oxalobacteraceae bacterium OM1]